MSPQPRDANRAIIEMIEMMKMNKVVGTTVGFFREGWRRSRSVTQYLVPSTKVLMAIR
jgi:hypothetical protein